MINQFNDKTFFCLFDLINAFHLINRHDMEKTSRPLYDGSPTPMNDEFDTVVYYKSIQWKLNRRLTVYMSVGVMKDGKAKMMDLQPHHDKRYDFIPAKYNNFLLLIDAAKHKVVH